MKDTLESVWKHREGFIYPRLFGKRCRGIFVLEPDLFLKTFKQQNFDPRWLHYGVHEHGPSNRGTYFYVTSGCSNPWEIDPDDYGLLESSGFGTELVLETEEAADWPILVLKRLLAFNILLVHGKLGEPNPLDFWHRIPLGGPIVGTSALTHLLIAPPESYEPQFTLASGKVDLLHAVGITQQERGYAKTHGSSEILELLKKADAFPVTKPNRKSVIE